MIGSLNNRIMAGWPLFVYPNFFCSQNKPAERRSHPLVLAKVLAILSTSGETVRAQLRTQIREKRAQRELPVVTVADAGAMALPTIAFVGCR